jgi:hypothetical protein
MIVDQDGTQYGTTDEAPKMRVAVAVPSGDLVPMGFAFDLAQMVGATIAARPDIDIRLTNVQGTTIHASRKSLVEMAIKNDCTHILFIDSDMRFPRHSLSRLLHHNLPIVAANYVTRRSPTLPVSFKDDSHTISSRVYTEPGETGLEEIAATGLGMCLIDLDVFRAMEQPWFSFAWNENHDVIGEDVWFFRKARELGLPVMLDHGLSQSIKHVGIHLYEMSDALVQRELRAEAGEKASV